MGLMSKIIQKEKESVKAPSLLSADELTSEEYEYLFNLIKASTFKGTELEILYSIIIKLQKRYLELGKNT